MEIKTISSEITERIITEQQLLDIYSISLDDWEVEKKVINTWEVGAKDDKGNIVTTPLFQVKVWLKSRKPVMEMEQIRQDFIDELKKISPKVEPKKYEPAIDKAPNMLQINIFDLHFGKLAWKEETGASYNIEIAAELFNDAIDTFIEDTKEFHIDKILFPVGNDFFNSDHAYPYNSTTKGTSQTESNVWKETFTKGRQLLVENIKKLSKIAPVDVIIVLSNHDMERGYYLGDSLEAYFHNDSNVNINNGPTTRKYYKYHNILLGFVHGDKESINNLPLIMCQEQAVNWGLTKYREFHLGHIHHSKSTIYNPIRELQGVMIRHMPSLSASDAWHVESGYIGSKRSAEAYLWSQDKGLKSILYYTL